MSYSLDDDFLNGLINSLDAPVFVKDRAHRWLFLNDSMCRLFGVPREKLIGKSDYDFFPREQADVFWTMDEAVFTSGEVNENEEFFTDESGAVHSIVTRKSLFHMASGQPILVGFIIDVTKQRTIEKLLNEKQKWLKLAVDGADLGLWDWWIKEDRVAFSSHWMSMLDYEPGDITDNSSAGCFNLIHEDDRERVRKSLTDYVNGVSKAYSLEMRMRTKGGEYCWVLTKGRIVERDVAGKPLRMAGTHLDINQIKHKEEQLQAKLDELKSARTHLELQTAELIEARLAAEQASQSKSEFLANMSHEIRTPMTGVLGMAELLKEGELNEGQRELVDNIIFSGRILLTVINDILDFSKIEAQKIEISKQPFDITALINGLEKMLSNHADTAGVTLSLVIDPAAPRWIVGDCARLQQVLTNLLANSIKFTPAGGCVLLNVNAADKVDREWRLTFDVFDSGIGINEADQARILNPFEQARDGAAAKKGGTGLGLAISNRLIQMMGGELVIHSKIGTGSTFCFSLPCIAVDAPAGSVRKEEVALYSKSGPLRILVAEDNLVNQKLIERVLAREGHSVQMVNNGEEALASAKAGTFDLILMDIQMPVMDGTTATRLLKDDPDLHGLPVIALTAHALNDERDTYLAAGMDGYVSKPINRKQLFEEIDRVVAGSLQVKQSLP